MTTSSTNNSVFRSFFEKQKLTRPNFIDWYRQLNIVLLIKDKLHYLEHHIFSIPETPEGQQVAPEVLEAYYAWIKGSKEIAILMLMKRLGHPVTLGLGNYNMHSMGKTVNELHDMLKLHQQTLTLPKSNAPAIHAIQAGKIPPPPKRENPTKDSICHKCREIGHWKRNCPQYLADLMKKKKNTASEAGGLGIFVIELNTILNRSWIYDTGCGTYICNTKQGLRASRKLKPGALSLYVGNGQREAVKAIDAVYLCLPSRLEIVLHNCHYAPSITRGVIYVSRLYEDGYVNRFVDNTIQVSWNNVVYFSAVPRDGIFKIDLSNSLTNESSIYAVSNKRAKLDLDFALLWHCRLGHISKKHIEKLQHYGLLNSSDLRAFENCVSCMSGKMARKPYTHQVERAKDLLGLIHTDEDTHPSLDTSLNHEEDDLEIDEPQSDIVPIRRSTRTRHAPDRMCLYIDAEEHELGDLGEPANYKATLLDPESAKWLNAMNVKMQSMKDNEVGSSYGESYTQTPWIDYEETFSPCADIRAIRILIDIAAYYDYEIWQMDVKTAFLNEYLNEEVYMEKPEGFVNPEYPNRSVKTYLGKCFAMEDLGEAAYILGIKIYRDRLKRLIGLCQSAYIEKILKRYCMKNYKHGSIPMQEKLKLSKSQGASTPAEMKRMQNVPYASAVGSIMYAVRCTRLDVVFAQNITSQFQQNPRDIHWTTVKNILKYPKNTKDMFLIYEGDQKRELRVSCYTDAGYLTDADDLKS
nr:hypothetical protein [Tanacetum cinerariifolium]